MKVTDVTVEVSGVDHWGNPIIPYIRNTTQTIKWTKDLTIGTNILENINTSQIEKIITISTPYTKHYFCNECMDWGCKACKASDSAIRASQGIFS